jgi:hypothetical protein
LFLPAEFFVDGAQILSGTISAAKGQTLVAKQENARAFMFAALKRKDWNFATNAPFIHGADLKNLQIHG